MAKQIPFLVAELGPNVESFTLHLYAALAEKERRMISERTRLALRAKARRGTLLGNRKNLGVAQERGRRAQTENAQRFSQDVLPTIREIEAAGIRSLSGIAEALNRRGISTVRGGQWYPTTVRNLMLRCTP